MAGKFIFNLFRKDAPAEKTEQPAAAAGAKGETVGAPIEGKVIPLSQVEDEAFSSEAMGKGVAIIPAVGRVYAPVDGTVTTFFPTGHAIGIQSDSGAEILIHVGMDTVQLDGKGFTPKVKQDARVKKGDLLLEFDMELIQKEGYAIVTPVVITNSDDYEDVVPADVENVKSGDAIITTV